MAGFSFRWACYSCFSSAVRLRPSHFPSLAHPASLPGSSASSSSCRTEGSSAVFPSLTDVGRVPRRSLHRRRLVCRHGCLLRWIRLRSYTGWRLRLWVVGWASLGLVLVVCWCCLLLTDAPLVLLPVIIAVAATNTTPRCSSSSTWATADEHDDHQQQEVF